ncbi:MAG: sigma-70 family RNA polymerase sigma factor [Bacteroidia bacterium]
MTDQEILLNIRNGNLNKPVKLLYNEFPKIKAGIISAGGDAETAEELFHDALIVLIEKVNHPAFELKSKLSTFLYGIARFLWMNAHRKQARNNKVDWADDIEFSDLLGPYDNEREEKLLAMEKIIASLSVKCQSIFERFYFKNESMDKIAKALGFSSVNSAKTQKYKCMEQAIKLASETTLKR